MNSTLGLFVLLSKLAIDIIDLTFISLIGSQDNALINYTLNSTIYLGPNVVITTGPSSYKSRFIYYFRIAYYQKRLSFNRGLIKKLWCWYLKSRSNGVQLTIILSLYLWLSQLHNEHYQLRSTTGYKNILVSNISWYVSLAAWSTLIKFLEIDSVNNNNNDNALLQK